MLELSLLMRTSTFDPPIRGPWTMTATLLAACVIAGAWTPCQERSREELALALIRRLVRETVRDWWYHETTFHRVPTSSDGLTERWVPHIPIDCGNSDEGDFDPKVATTFGIELCRIFGVSAEADLVVADPGVHAVL